MDVFALGGCRDGAARRWLAAVAAVWLVAEVGAMLVISSGGGAADLLAQLPLVGGPAPSCVSQPVQVTSAEPRVRIQRVANGTNGWMVSASGVDCMVVSFARPAGFAGHHKFTHRSADPVMLAHYASGSLYTTSQDGGRYHITAVGPGGLTELSGRLPVRALSPWEMAFKLASSLNPDQA